ncbi:MAG TPA: oligosaccharide flippase family protein [Polyangiaceae bacterium]|nr:oligosaccharide flippase family protein [Polyangiaceae bacterium]
MTRGPAQDGLRKRLLSRNLVRAGITTYAFSALTLAANLVSGIVTARALGPSGRGVTVALSTVSLLAGFLFAMGVAQSLSYFIARRPEDGPPLLSTWAVMLLPLAVTAIAICELLLPTIFATDGDEAIAIGRWFVVTIALVIALELNYGLMLGTQDFFAYNVLRFAAPALGTVSIVVLWQLDQLTVESALIALTAGTAVTLTVGLTRSVQRIGLGPIDLRLGRRALWYGVRGQGNTVASNLNARLDVAMLPAFVSTANVGVYSVATNVSLIVYQLSNTFAGLVLPAAASDPKRGAVKVVGSLYATLAVAGAMAVALAFLARPLLRVVYGDEFADAAEPLLLLLPGSVLFAGSSILSAGIYAANRPFTATLAQLLGMLVTVVGLFVFLRSGGITAAALVSSAAYGTVFVTTLLVYKSISGLSWRALLPTPGRLRALAR